MCLRVNQKLTPGQRFAGYPHSSNYYIVALKKGKIKMKKEGTFEIQGEELKKRNVLTDASLSLLDTKPLRKKMVGGTLQDFGIEIPANELVEEFKQWMNKNKLGGSWNVMFTEFVVMKYSKINKQEFQKKLHTNSLDAMANDVRYLKGAADFHKEARKFVDSMWIVTSDMNPELLEALKSNTHINSELSIDEFDLILEGGNFNKEALYERAETILIERNLLSDKNDLTNTMIIEDDLKGGIGAKKLREHGATVVGLNPVKDIREQMAELTDFTVESHAEINVKGK